MIKMLLLAAGIAIGYGYGFRDAKHHTHNIVERTIQRVGGAVRDRVRNDVDTKLQDVGK